MPPLPGPVANALNLDPVKYNQTAASSAHIRGRFNPNMDPATAQSAAEYHLAMAEFHRRQAEIIDETSIMVPQ